MYFGLLLASFMYLFVYVFFVYGTQVSRRDSYGHPIWYSTLTSSDLNQKEGYTDNFYKYSFKSLKWLNSMEITFFITSLLDHNIINLIKPWLHVIKLVMGCSNVRFP